MAKEIKALIESYRQCAETRETRREPLQQFPFPHQPWESVAMDIFKSKNKNFLLIVDRYSRYPEVEELQNLIMVHTIDKMKDIYYIQIMDHSFLLFITQLYSKLLKR